MRPEHHPEIKPATSCSLVLLVAGAAHRQDVIVKPRASAHYAAEPYREVLAGTRKRWGETSGQRASRPGMSAR